MTGIDGRKTTNVTKKDIPRASRTSKKVGPVKNTGVLEEEPGSPKPIFNIWVLYGFVRAKYRFCTALNTGSVRMKPVFFGKNRVFPVFPEEKPGS